MQKRLFEEACIIKDNEIRIASRALRNHFNEIMSLGEDQRKNVYRLFKCFLMSGFGLEYLRNINLIVRSRLMSAGEEKQKDFCSWLEKDLMENVIYEIMETEVFENPRALNELTDIIASMCSYFRETSEEDIDSEMDYVLDMPYQIREMVRESSNVPNYYSYSCRAEDTWWHEKRTVNISPSNVSFKYSVDWKR